jgi:hypothetical protein
MISEMVIQPQFQLQFQVFLPVRMIESRLTHSLNYESEEVYQNGNEINSDPHELLKTVKELNIVTIVPSCEHCVSYPSLRNLVLLTSD